MTDLPPADRTLRLGRRAFLHRGALVLLGASAGSAAAAELLHAAGAAPTLRVGLLTDLHHADRDPAGTRFYRETLGKLAEATHRFRAERPDLVAVLGDLIDAADSVETEKRYAAEVLAALGSVPAPLHFVLGNHCVSTLTKPEFLGVVGQAESFYSFDAGEHHFVVLDACFRADGVPYGRNNFDWKDANVPPAELEWLRADLAATDRPTLVLAHQRLDDPGPHGVRNAAAVREVLAGSGRVQAVFQGHSHKNDYRQADGIHFVTLVAMVEGSGGENSGYAVLDLLPDGAMRLNGFRRQQSAELPRRANPRTTG